MKTKKIITSILLTIAICFVHTASVSATSETFSETEYFIQGNCIVDSDGHKYSHFFNTSGEAISLSEALSILNNNSDVLQNPNSRMAVPGTHSVQLNSVKNYTGTAKKLTPDVEGPMDVSYTLSTTSSSSISGSFSVSVKELIFKTVEASVSVSITSTSVQTETVTVSGTVNTGNIGAIYFKPYYVKATGTYSNNGGVDTESFTSYYPRLLSNGLADGLFYLYQN